MKKVIMSLVIMSLFLLSFIIVSAQEDADELDLPEPKKIGFFANAFDNMNLAFTFNREKRIEKALRFAEKRLAEAESLAEEDPERAEKARERYEAFLEKAEEAMEKMAERQAENPDESEEGLSRLVRAENRLEKHREIAEAIYLRTLERFQENNASEDKIAKLDERYAKITARLQRVEDRLLQRKDNAKTRHKNLSGETDEELNNSVTEIERREGLTSAREKRMARAILRIERFTKIGVRNVERFQNRLDDANLTEEQRELLQNRIEISMERVQRYEELALRTQGREGLNAGRNYSRNISIRTTSINEI